MPGRMPMKPSICSGLRRSSLVRSAAVRSELLTICAICSDESGGKLCSAVAGWALTNRATLAPTANRRPFVTLFMTLLVVICDFARSDHSHLGTGDATTLDGLSYPADEGAS